MRWWHRRLIGVLVVAVSGAPVAGEERRVPLRMEVPQGSSVIYHPWQHMKAKDVEWPEHPDRLGLMVPAGTENVARGMAVTSDREPEIGELGMVTDGEKGGTDGTFIWLPAGVRWIQIDLGESTPIYAVAMWHEASYQRAYRDVVVRVSDDAEFAKGVTTIFNNDADGSAGLGKGKDREYVETVFGRVIDSKGVRGRYVRLYSNGSRRDRGVDGETLWTEVEVYGTLTATGRAFREEQAKSAKRATTRPAEPARVRPR